MFARVNALPKLRIVVFLLFCYDNGLSDQIGVAYVKVLDCCFGYLFPVFAVFPIVSPQLPEIIVLSALYLRIKNIATSSLWYGPQTHNLENNHSTKSNSGGSDSEDSSSGVWGPWSRP